MDIKLQTCIRVFIFDCFHVSTILYFYNIRIRLVFMVKRMSQKLRRLDFLRNQINKVKKSVFICMQ